MDNRSLYIIGRPGVGKSTAIENLFFEELENDTALFLIDPHGETLSRIADALPRSVIKRTRVIDPEDCCIGFDPLKYIDLTHEGLKSIWADTWGARMDWILRVSEMTVAANGLTLHDIPRLFFDQRFRITCLKKITNRDIRDFWLQEFPAKYEKARDNPDSPILNKIGQLKLSPIDKILCQKSPKLDFTQAIEERLIVLVSLNKAFVGDQSVGILGALTTASIMGATLQVNAKRIRALKKPLKVALFADEFPLFGTSLYRTILAEYRKYGLNRVVVASQHITQIEVSLRESILSNVGEKIIFNIEPQDAEILAPYYDRSTPGSETFNIANITELPPFHALVDGVTTTMPPFTPPYGTGKLEDVRLHSRLHFAR